MNEYTSFAEVYDVFMDNVPYEAWADRIEELIRRFSGGRRIADLGCGTGTMTELLAARGYDMTGVDLSVDMLGIAAGKREAAGSATLYVCQDMRSLDLGERYPVMTCVCDCVNYLLTDEDLRGMFRSVKEHLDDNGIFIFDFNTVHKYRDVIGSSTIAESREDCAFIWNNWFDEQTCINTCELTLFMALQEESPDDSSDGEYDFGALEEGGGLFLRSVETHLQKGYTAKDMETLAAGEGLRLLLCTDGYSDAAVHPASERILFVLTHA